MILDHDVEDLLITYLNQVLPDYGIDINVADRVPTDNLPAITLVRTGGVRRDLVTDEAQITIDVRHYDAGQAMAVVLRIRAIVNDLWSQQISGVQIYTVRELAGPYSNPTSSDLYRYSLSFLVAVRSSQAVAQPRSMK